MDGGDARFVTCGDSCLLFAISIASIGSARIPCKSFGYWHKYSVRLYQGQDRGQIDKQAEAA